MVKDDNKLTGLFQDRRPLMDELEMQDHANVSCCLFAGCAMSGLIADAKTLIDKARVETQVSARLCLISLKL